MRYLIILGMVLLCLAVFVTDAEADATDNAVVIGAFQRLSALRSFRETTTINSGLGKMLFHREWLKMPAMLRTTMFWSHAGTGVVIRTPNACYMQNGPSSPWTKRKATPSEKKLLMKGLDYKKDLDLDKCEFTYKGIASLAGVPTRFYLFREMTENATTTGGKVWIGSADDLPRRCDFETSKVGPYEILFDSFNGPVSADLPVVGVKHLPQHHEP